jgi:hypothetical protein
VKIACLDASKNAVGDTACDFSLIPGLGEVCGVVVIGEEAAFNQNRRASRLNQHDVIGISKSFTGNACIRQRTLELPAYLG